MAKKLKRFLRADFLRDKRPLPKTLEFLRNVKFHAVVEDTSGTRIKRTVELLPRDFKALAEGRQHYDTVVKQNDELVAKNKSLDEELSEADEELSEARQKIKILEHNNNLLMRDPTERLDMKPRERSPRNYFNVAEDAGFQSNGPALQGGLPSLGKKK